MGTPEFAIPSLERLIEAKYEVCAVVTIPDKPSGRGQKITASAVKLAAQKHGLNILQPENLRDSSFLEQLRVPRPDIIVVVAFRILPPEVFQIPRLGSFNLHASLLPKYRGAAPINWAIINGEVETGVTTFFLHEKVDTGPIILRARVKIGEDESAGELHDKLAVVGGEIVLQTVRLIEHGKVQPRDQDHALVSIAPKIRKEMCAIDWRKTASEIHNFIRGLSPSPCAWTIHNKKQIRVLKTKKIDRSSVSPEILGRAVGTVSFVDKDSLYVSTSTDIISILELQLEGRRKMGISEFLRGYQIKIGDRFWHDQ